MNRYPPNQFIISSESPHLYSSKRFAEEALKLGYEISHQNPYQMTLELTSCNEQKEANYYNKNILIHRTTGVRYDDHDLLFSTSLEDKGFKVINPIKPLSSFRSKDIQQLFFNRFQIPTIPTISSRGKIDENKLELIKKLSPNEKYIIKMNRGNQGIGVNFISNFLSLKSLLETFEAINDQKFIIQPYLKHETELRVFFIKNEIYSIIERKIDHSDFRGNSRNSTGRVLNKINSQLEELIYRAILESKLEYGGIDIFDYQNQYYFLEINAIAGFKQIEELTTKNIAKEIIIKLS